MDILNLVKDEKSKSNLEKLMNGETINNAKPFKKKTSKKVSLKNPKSAKHFEEYHFKEGKELIDHIRSGKKAYRGNEYGWITVDKNDPNMVVSFQRQEDTGKMGFSYESLDTFKAYVKVLENQKIGSYIDFWHKKPFEKRVKDEDSDSE